MPLSRGAIQVTAVARRVRRGEIPAPDYHVVAFENRFPSLGAPVGPLEAGAGGRVDITVTRSSHGWLTGEAYQTFTFNS